MLRLPRVRGRARAAAISLAMTCVVAATVAGCSSLDHWERRTIFQHEAALRVDGRDAPDGVVEFDLAVPGGGVTGQDKVHAWYLPSQQKDAPTVLYLHGARHNLYGNASRIERLADLGYNVLAVDYRGFGRSTPILPSEATAIEDARLAYVELARREPAAARRIVYGYSLGGAVAIALAHDAQDLAGVVVESSFTSIPDVVRTMRWGWLMRPPLVNMAVTQDFDSERRIAAVTRPLLFLHGTADSIVPHEMSDRLYAAARQVPAQYKRIIKIDGASHRGALAMAASDYGDALRQFAQLAASSVTTHVAGSGSPAGAGTTAVLHSAAAAGAAHGLH